MKKIILFSFVLFSLVSCSKDEPENFTSKLQLEVSYADEAYNEPFAETSVTVRLTNLLYGSTSENEYPLGSILIENLVAGSYDVEISSSFSKEEFRTLTGEELLSESIIFNASAKNVSVQEDASHEMKLVAGRSGGFVIKQIYYAGSDGRDGAAFRDQFFEIYNNTDEVLYADSLYFGRLWGRANPNDDQHHFQSNGQLDWSKSKDMSDTEGANSKYVYARDLFMIPGSGQDHPVQPGESVIIAQNALNHKVPFTGTNGKEISVRNPELTIDLSGADFETFFGDIPGVNPLASDVDNQDVPNVEVLLNQGRDWILDNPGRDSYFIFNGQDREAVTTLPDYYAPSLTAPGNNASKYKQLPIDWILDGVEVQPNVSADQIPKKLDANIDAGYIHVTDGSYSSQAVIRKTSGMSSGRKVLQDSNNSRNDFTVIKANPRGFAE
ncbi:MAG: DUF4876 domain-containing protein [Sphingobacterium sp.]